MFRWERKLLKQKSIRFIAGVDEAGRGPLAGPLVVAAVIIKPEGRFFSFHPVFRNKIADSKALSLPQRETAFSEIMVKAWVGIGIARQDLIDEFDISLATRFAAEAAISNLRKKPQHILTDGGIILPPHYAYTSIIKGEQKCFSIACASIVAKVIRDRIMDVYDQFFPHYAFREHKGYGTKLHLEQLRKYGPSPIHRKSFWPVSHWQER